MVTIDVTIHGGFKTSTIDSGNLGTMDGGTASKDFTITNVSTNQNVSIDSVGVSVDGDPSFNADYGFEVSKWIQQWDDSEDEVDVIVTVEWDTDPGNGNDIQLDYTIKG